MNTDTTQSGAEPSDHADTSVEQVVTEAELHDDVGHDQTDPTESEQDDEGSPADETEIEIDGQSYKVPATLKDAFMRTKDYTAKTMEIAETRRAVEAERQALAAQAEAQKEYLADHVRVTQLQQTIDYYANVDWDRADDENPDVAAREWRKYQQAQIALNDAKSELKTKEENRSKEQQSQRDQALRQTGEILRKDIPGWGQPLAIKLMETATKFGVTHEELANETDPRVWKLLHAAHQGTQAQTKQATQARAQQSAATAPIRTVGAKAPPPSPMSDKASIDAWMRARNDQRKAR